MARCLLVCALFAAVGCGQSDSAPALSESNPSLTYSGTLGEPIPATIYEDIVVVNVTVNGVTGSVAVDTGSPVVGLDPAPFAAASLPSGAGTVASFDLGAIAISNAPVVGANLLSSGDPTFPIDGTMGCAILCAFAIGLDYRDATLTLGKPASLPANIDSPGQSVAFTLLGGGEGMLDDVPGVIDIPRSRIPITATIEGQTHAMVLDTGASYVFLSTSVFSSLTADGRATMTAEAEQIGGSSSSTLTRLESVVVGGAEVDGPLAFDDPSVDDVITQVGAEIGHPIDGLIGGSFLRQFYVTIDYPAGELHLQRYTVGGPTFDVFDRVGVSVGDPAPTGGAAVDQVFAGTDASNKGVAVGDVVLAVDGQSVAGLDERVLDALFTGPVGTTKMIQFGAAASSALANQTVAIAVDDVLPL